METRDVVSGAIAHCEAKIYENDNKTMFRTYLRNIQSGIYVGDDFEVTPSDYISVPARERFAAWMAEKLGEVFVEVEVKAKTIYFTCHVKRRHVDWVRKDPNNWHF